MSVEVQGTELDPSTVNREDMVLAVLHAENQIFCQCGDCRKLFFAGSFAALAIIGEHKLLVGRDPPVIHCGKDRHVPISFFGQEEALDTVRALRKWFLSAAGTVEGLNLHATHRHIFERGNYEVLEVPN